MSSIMDHESYASLHGPAHAQSCRIGGPPAVRAQHAQTNNTQHARAHSPSHTKRHNRVQHKQRKPSLTKYWRARVRAAKGLVRVRCGGPDARWCDVVSQRAVGSRWSPVAATSKAVVLAQGGARCRTQSTARCRLPSAGVAARHRARDATGQRGCARCGEE
jgi:hypothetical protein